MEKEITKIYTFCKLNEFGKKSHVEFGYNNKTNLFYTKYKFNTMKKAKLHTHENRAICELFFYKVITFLLS